MAFFMVFPPLLMMQQVISAGMQMPDLTMRGYSFADPPRDIKKFMKDSFSLVRNVPAATACLLLENHAFVAQPKAIPL
jgi:hypothetical protein